MHKGACLCGGVHYEVDAQLGMAGYCHCTRCRRNAGAGFSAAALVPPDALRITQGEELVTTYAEEGFSARSFCSRCGSPLYGKGGNFTIVMAGTLEDQAAFTPQFHIMVDYKAPWDQINDGLPQYGEFPPMP